MTEKHFLTKVFKGQDFNIEEQVTIISKFTQVNFNKHDFLLREGKTENFYWFLEKGFIRSFVIDANGHDITTAFYTAGDIVIDWSSFFLRNPTRENIQALTDCTCWQIDFARFQKLFHGIPAFREQGRTSLAGSYFALKKHNISIIADSSKERYLHLQNEKPNLLQNVSLKHIATYLGIKDTSLSRIRREIAEE